MFQTEGRREGSGHIARSGANDTIGPIAPKDSDYICATEVLCSGWGSTGTPVRKHCVQGGSVLGHMYGHTQGVESYLSVEKSRLECY